MLIATDCYTKWVVAIGLKRASGAIVTKFISDNVIRRFCIPKLFSLITELSL